MGTGIPGQRFNYQKHGLATKQDWQQVRLSVPRLGPPALQSRSRRATAGCASSQRMRRRRRGLRGGLVAGKPRAAAVTLAHGPSASNNHYWPEIYTNLAWSTASGTARLRLRHGGPGPLRQRADLRLRPLRHRARICRGSCSPDDRPPLHAARRRRLARGDGRRLREGADRARGAADFGRAEVQRIAADVQILAASPASSPSASAPPAGPSSSFATKVRALMEPVLDHARRARPRLGGDRRRVARPLPRRHHLRAAELAARLLALPAAGDAGRAPRPRVAARLRRHRVRSSPTPRRRRHRGARARRPTVAGGPLAKIDGRFAPRASPSRCASARGRADPILHYRHVNQAERWRSTAMHGTATASPPRSRPTTRSRTSTCNTSSASPVRGRRCWCPASRATWPTSPM